MVLYNLVANVVEPWLFEVLRPARTINVGALKGDCRLAIVDAAELSVFETMREAQRGGAGERTYLTTIVTLLAKSAFRIAYSRTVSRNKPS